MNVTDLVNVTSIVDIGTVINTSTSYFFGDVILCLFFIITLLIFSKRYNFKEVFVAVSASTVFVGILLWAIHWLPVLHLWYPIVLFVASLLIYKLTE